MKKVLLFFISLIFYYLLLTVIVFSFSYISLINGKTYDLFWIKSIQKKIYFRGYRNIWQYNNDCVSYDEKLLYKPKIGQCNFLNPEFSTKLSFDKFSRIHDLNKNDDFIEDYILVLGDSIAMGWGVNNNETFSYLLEKSLGKKVYNLGVSSYGTVREITRMISSPYYKNSKVIIIQYHPNDLNENSKLNFDKTYSENEFKKIFETKKHNLNSISFILRNLKSSVRLFFSDFKRLILNEKNYEIIDFSEDKKYLEKIIKKKIDLKSKEVIVFLPIAPYQKVKNFPKSKNNIKYIVFELGKSDFFNIDDHPNKKGHETIAKKLENLIFKKE